MVSLVHEHVIEYWKLNREVDGKAHLFISSVKIYFIGTLNNKKNAIL